MPCFLVLAASFLFAFAASAQEPTEPEPESSGPSSYGVLYEAEGVAETFALAQQGLKREDWDDLFTYMVDEHGMAPIPEPFRTKILDYLSAHYGPDRPHFPK